MGLFKKNQKENQENHTCCVGDIENLIIKENSNSDGICNCGVVNTSLKADQVNEEVNNATHSIKILGSGCKNCITLTQNVEEALKEMELEAQVIKVTDFAEITGYGIMTTPALVVNEKVVSYGKVLKPNEVIKILTKVLGV